MRAFILIFQSKLFFQAVSDLESWNANLESCANPKAAKVAPNLKKKFGEQKTKIERICKKKVARKNKKENNKKSKKD